MSEVRKIILSLALLAGLTIAVYSFAVNGSFKTMDDEYSIVRNEKIHSFRNLPEVLSSSFFGGNSYYRPLISVSFMVEYFFFKLNPVPYYLDNILLHLANTLLVFGIMFQLTRRRETALAVAFLFALHPIQWEAVSNIPGRAILLCTFFYFTAFYFFTRSGEKKRYSYISFVAFALALLCKESAGVLPLLLASYLIFVKWQEIKIWKIVNAMIPYGAIAVTYLVIRRVLGLTALYQWPSVYQLMLGFLSFLRSVITDLRLLVFPVDLYFDRSQPFFTNFFNPGLIFTICFFAAIIIILRQRRTLLSGVEAFLISWFFIELLPVSQIISTVGVQPGYISTAEHFLYTPCVGFFALAVFAFERFKVVNSEFKILSPAVLRFTMGGLLIFFVLLTIQYNVYSSNETAMFERTLQINPTNTRIRSSLALSYAKNNRFDLAEKNYRKVLETEPYNVRARIGLGKALCDLGKYWEGIHEYESVREPGNLKELLDENLKSTLLFMISRYEQKFKSEPQNARVPYSLGVVYSKLGQPQDAVAFYEKAVGLDANFKDAAYNLGATYEILGQREKAIGIYQQVVLMRMGESTDELDRMAASRLAELALHSQDPRIVPAQ